MFIAKDFHQISKIIQKVKTLLYLYPSSKLVDIPTYLHQLTMFDYCRI